MASLVLINTDKILEARNEAANLKAQTEELRGRLTALKSSLEWKVASREAIDDNLKAICDELTNQIEFMENATKLCSLVETKTNETNNSLIQAISKILLSIVGIASVIGTVIHNIFHSGNGSNGNNILNVNDQSTNTVPITNTTVPVSNTKQYQNSPVNYGKSDFSDFKTVNSYDPSMVIGQKDPRWDSVFRDENNKNVGCTCTAGTILHNMKHPDNILTPPDCKNSKKGLNWNDYMIKDESTKGMSPQQQRSKIGEYITNGEPTMVRINGSYGGHNLVCIGLRDGADPTNLSNADILCIDPADGKVKTLQQGIKYIKGSTEIDTSWALATAK